ncbi:HAMP domain-containing histidine kinase [Gracilibacillus caseinilyticus]|uniref:histidine kinase n=1 Tax=Gracilibacillus caseinilyticus TaxID=2932256 RepID=A0ABY4EYZ0_9BACI|nr:HAMP domain-containing sensor histidine kinase [Gracilibacillus caseinilyticus]UOQ49067.1 HAMP domain-containing histidine kinase [Gracilibacillus caseinilyticus]
MFTKHKKVSLQRYWTTRYLVTLVIGLAVIAIISAMWIRHTTLDNRLNIMEFMAEETASRIANMSDSGTLPPEFEMHRLLDDPGRFMNIESNPTIYVTDNDGGIENSNLPPNSNGQTISQSIIDDEETIQLISSDSEDLGDVYIVKKPIERDESQIGWVIYVETKSNLSQVNQEYGQLTIMIISLLLLGWGAIYFLSGRLSKPIKEVAKAAKQVENGNYQVHFSNQAKEEEIADLIQSFQEMTQKLEHLEALRTELLAGVSHELKTPVTSISGLLRAIDDGVVDEQEAKEFLKMSIKETDKMKTMVEDLLAFNKFAANAVPVTLETYLINDIVKDALDLWTKTQKSESLTVETEWLADDWMVEADPVRVQQILTNLLNNASQAMVATGTIKVKLHIEENKVLIDVTDSGVGIQSEEQSYIFERFYRGTNKKFKVGGLGLGLPFSKMIANVLNGDLQLVESNNTSTTFRMILPVSKQDPAN